jgi:hypothetical protein
MADTLHPDFDPTTTKDGESGIQAMLLLTLLQRISLSRTKGLWQTGNGMKVWRELAGEDHSSLHPRERVMLLWLYRECEGWWEWMPGAPEPDFFEAPVWERMTGVRLPE